MKTLFNNMKNRPEWIINFVSHLRTLSPERKFSIMISLIVLFSFLIIFAKLNSEGKNVTNLASLQNKRNKVILRELNYFHSVLHTAETNPLNTKQQQMALQLLEKDIDSVQKTITDVAKSTEVQKVSKQILLVKDDVDAQMNDIKKAISENFGSKQYLEASALPFNVIAVDVISGQTYITVDYANHIFPLSIGDLIAGWRAYSADYNSGVAEFANAKNQYVKVSLHGESNSG